MSITPNKKNINSTETNVAPVFHVTAIRDKEPIFVPFKELDWANLQVYNPSVVKLGEQFHMFVRAKGTKDEQSRLGYAISDDGIHFSLDNKPFLERDLQDPAETIGVEDARFTVMEDGPVNIDGQDYSIFGSYTGARKWRAQIKLLGVSKDLQNISRRFTMLPHWDRDKAPEDRDLWNRDATGRNIIFPGVQWDQETPDWTKAAGIFPRKIDGKYTALWGEYKIRLAQSKDGEHWTSAENPVLEQRQGKFDSAYVEMGPAPMLTEDGWLIIYNGVNSLEQKGRKYGIGWAILDKNDPAKVIARCEEPVLLPEMPDEMSGRIDIANIHGKTASELTPDEFEKYKDQLPMAVFCNGAVKLNRDKDGNDQFALFYGAGDKITKRAVITLKVIHR